MNWFTVTVCDVSHVSAELVRMPHTDNLTDHWGSDGDYDFGNVPLSWAIQCITLIITLTDALKGCFLNTFYPAGCQTAPDSVWRTTENGQCTATLSAPVMFENIGSILFCSLLQLISSSLVHLKPDILTDW